MSSANFLKTFEEEKMADLLRIQDSQNPGYYTNRQDDVMSQTSKAYDFSSNHQDSFVDRVMGKKQIGNNYLRKFKILTSKCHIGPYHNSNSDAFMLGHYKDIEVSRNARGMIIGRNSISNVRHQGIS